jgi:hypothetical protein
VNKALDASDLSALKKHVGAHDVVLCELERVSEGVVDVGLGSEMHDGVDFFGFKDIVDKIRTANISADKLVVREVLDLIKVLNARAICLQYYP